ncbi:TraR/DksA family transcriptional regulator [Desulfospira joergensenii]|uniref:TraR/DksA family transcriptional regulator n=1 Tax=Desulfospira joergensenii TaxID=53329 RepID=UPI00041215BB|nr:TraR/DksA C4-type zinc finger protein [Desulfospira joergensenii]
MEFVSIDLLGSGSLNRDQVEHFRTMLLKRLDELLYSATHEMIELRSRNGGEIEYLDRASNEADQTMRLRIRSRESLLIKKIRKALERIENNSYGICESCEEDISLERLEARPVTTKCIHCKEEEERKELYYQIGRPHEPRVSRRE